MKIWATVWGAVDAVMQGGFAITLTWFVCRIFDLREFEAFVALLGSFFFVMWAHAGLVLYAVNTEPPTGGEIPK